MKERDSLHRFVFEHLPMRGLVVHLDAAWRAVLERAEYPEPLRRVLGEAMAAAALLASTVKFQGVLSLQIQGQGPVRLLLVQCTSERTLRGLVRWDGPVEQARFGELMGDGTLLITIESGQRGEPYQGIISLDQAKSLGDALETYFDRSEQLPTRLRLSADDRQAAGLLLQRVPGESPDADAWNRIQTLGATLQEDELLGLDAQELLRRLFTEEDLRLFEAEPVAFRCTCSRERIGDMLRNLGRDEVRDILVEQGRVEVTCEFCNQQYVFDRVDAEGLFSEAPPPDLPTTRH